MKKALIIFASIITITTAFSGCGAKESSTAESTTAVATTTAATTEVQTTPPATTVPVTVPEVEPTTAELYEDPDGLYDDYGYISFNVPGAATGETYPPYTGPTDAPDDYEHLRASAW